MSEFSIELSTIAADLTRYSILLREATERIETLNSENQLLRARLRVADTKLAKYFAKVAKEQA